MSAMIARDATVRLLQEQDIAIATRLSSEAGWNQTADDWRMLLALAPEGCFGIDADDRLVATATLVCYGRDLAWIGMVLTDSQYRRRGFARKLLRHTIDRADELRLESLKLDATDQGQPLYETLGFRVEQPVERWWRAGGGAPENSRGHVDSLSPDDDRTAFGADRAQLIEALQARGRVCVRADGFCLSRPGRRANYIGPCVSRTAGVARRLIQGCAAAESYWDILPGNAAALALAADLGFTAQRKLLRMVRGRDLRGREEWIYGIAGFEFG
jgi:GNAT superfamily N-acetyltransferase